MKDFLFLKKNKLFIVPVYIFIVTLIFWGISQILIIQTQQLHIFENPIPSFQLSNYPILQRQYIPQISAQAAYVMESNSKIPIFSKNENIRFSPASTTKIMTALTALSYYKLSDILTVKRDYVEGSGLNLFRGEKFTFGNLLFAMMLPSANDAAYTIADNYPGGMNAFVSKMNEKINSLNLVDTHYQDPAGLKDDGDFTTAHDLAIISSVALNNPMLARVVNTKETIIQSADGLNTYPIKNLNKLLGLYGVVGLKTGYTDEAGQVLVTASSQSGHAFITVVMKSDDRFADTEKLLQYLSQNITYLSMFEK